MSVLDLKFSRARQQNPCTQQQQILKSNDQLLLQVVEKLFEVDKNANGIHFLQWEHNGISRRLNGYALGFESCWDIMGVGHDELEYGWCAAHAFYAVVE